jgi:hypothetical protein
MLATTPPHFLTLGLGLYAPPADLQARYRKLSMQHHPDRGGDKEAFQNVSIAYEALSTLERRLQYLREWAGSAPLAPPEEVQREFAKRLHQTLLLTQTPAVENVLDALQQRLSEDIQALGYRYQMTAATRDHRLGTVAQRLKHAAGTDTEWVLELTFRQAAEHEYCLRKEGILLTAVQQYAAAWNYQTDGAAAPTFSSAGNGKRVTIHGAALKTSGTLNTSPPPASSTQ